MRRLLTGRLGLLVRVALSAGLIAILFYEVGSADVVRRIGTASWPAFAGAIAILACSTLVVTPRWAVVLRGLGHPRRIGELIGSVFLGFLFNQLLPTAVGGDVIRAWRARQLGVPLDAAVHSVLLDRGVGVATFAAGAAIALPFAHPHRGGTALALAIGVVWALAGLGLAFLWGIGRVGEARRRFVGGVHRGLLGLRASVARIAGDPATVAGAVGFSVLNAGLVLGATWLIAADLGVGLGFADIALVVFVATLAATVPISLGGWGVREGALVWLLGLYDVPPDVALAISVLYGAAQTISSAPGALMLFRGGARPSPEMPGGGER